MTRTIILLFIILLRIVFTSCKSIIVKYRLLAIICLFLFSTLCTYTRAGKPDSSGESYQLLDSLIKVKKLNDKIILIQMGYDAVIAISCQKGIVVIDAGISTGLTAKYRKIIEKVFQRNDFACLINTHGHPDHTGGNSVFTGAVIIGQENCLNEISNQRKNPEEVKSSLDKIVKDYDNELQTLTPRTNEWNRVYCQKTRYQYAYNDVLKNLPVSVPDFTFRDSLDIFMGNVTFNLIYFGKAHSESDIIVHIPENKILMVGDLFSKYGRPGFGEENRKYSERWIKVAKWIENRLNDIDIVVDGHGQVLSKEDVRLFISYVKLKAAK
jgi:glyoxylase-like metal-dependent hydrolase (beta-lactamase superfamily II)